MSTTTTPNPNTQAISNARFLEWLFGRDKWEQAHVCGFDGDPMTTADTPGYWMGGRAKDHLAHLDPNWNNYYCVSLFSGHVRRKSEFLALHVLGIDDVGVKVEAQKALDLLGEPSYRIETSPGNEQWGYRLAPPIVDLARAERLQTRLTDVLGGRVRAPDPGHRAVTRYMRLPVGRNLKRSLGL